MGVNHLKQYASQVNGASAPTKRANSQATTRTTYNKPASNSGTTRVPHVGSDESYGNRALRTHDSPAQPPKGNANGGRAGAKSGQPKLGTRKGTQRPMSGGRMY